MRIEGSVLKYLCEYENMFDLIGFFIILIYNILIMFTSSKNHHTNFLCIGMLIANTRLLIHISVFNKPLRQMIMNIEHSII